jgi:hypothetical protein
VTFTIKNLANTRPSECTIFPFPLSLHLTTLRPFAIVLPPTACPLVACTVILEIPSSGDLSCSLFSSALYHQSVPLHLTICHPNNILIPNLVFRLSSLGSWFSARFLRSLMLGLGCRLLLRAAGSLQVCLSNIAGRGQHFSTHLCGRFAGKTLI